MDKRQLLQKMLTGQLSRREVDEITSLKKRHDLDGLSDEELRVLIAEIEDKEAAHDKYIEQLRKEGTHDAAAKAELIEYDKQLQSMTYRDLKKEVDELERKLAVLDC